MITIGERREYYKSNVIRDNVKTMAVINNYERVFGGIV